MRLRIVERKKLKINEVDNSSTVEASMPPSAYIKLTTEYADFNAIQTFISSGNHEQAKQLLTLKERKNFVEKQLGRSKTPLATQLLLGGINFLNPATDAKSWGAFDSEKSGISSLAVEVSDDIGKVRNHEGRNRSIYLWMKGENKINVTIYFSNVSINTVDQMPRTFISQFDEKSKVFKSDITTAIEKDSSSFRTVEGFINSLGPFPKQAAIDELKKKIIKVGNEQVVLMKAVMVDKGADGKYYTSIFKVGLYDKEVLNVPKSDGVEYWVEVNKHRIPPEKGPVTIS